MMRALLVAALTLSVSGAWAFGEKGSTVGRLFMGPDANASGGAAKAVPAASGDELADANWDDGDSSDLADEPAEVGSPISREALAKIMKHPTEPHFDPLRPLSGRWVRCSPAAATDSGASSVQDRFSSSDHSHFIHAVVKDSDSACKKPLSETRTNYECESSGKDSLTCKVLKVESRIGEGAWAQTQLSESELASRATKLSFVGLEKTHRHSKKKKSRAVVEAPASDDLRHLDVRLMPVAGGEPQAFHLDFAPVTPHTHRHATND